MKYLTLNKISTEAVEIATGKSWDEWVKTIDDFGGEEMTHKEIAKKLNEEFIENGWWCQGVTVGYEFAKGRRERERRQKQTMKLAYKKLLRQIRKRFGTL